MKKQKIGINYIYNLSYQILIMILPFITAPYVSRTLGPENVGIQSYTTSIQTYVSLFATLGTSAYGQREIARERDNAKRYSQLMAEIELLSIITSSCCIIGWGIFVVLCKQYKLYYLILSLNIMATMFDISWFYSGLEQYKYIVLRNAFFKLTGTVLILWLVRSEKDLWLYMLLLAASTFLGNLTMWISLPRFLVKPDFKTIRLKRHFRQTLVYFIPSIAVSVYTVLDKAMLGIITDNMYENGYYEQASKIIYMVKSIILSLNSVMYSRMSFLFAKKDIRELKSMMQKNLDFVIILGIPLMVGLSIVADDFVPIFFGDGYEHVIKLIILYSPIIIIGGLTSCIGGQYYSAIGKKAEATKYILVGSISNLVMNLLLIPSFGATGAVIASIVAEMLILILYISHSNRFVTWKMLSKAFYKSIWAVMIMSVYVCILKRVGLSVIIKLGTQMIGGAILYFSVLLVLKERCILSVAHSFKEKLMQFRKSK